MVLGIDLFQLLQKLFASGERFVSACDSVDAQYVAVEAP